MVHMFLHVLVPLIIAATFFSKQWKLAFLIMMATMLVDVDHLLASPIYDVGRCSIGFHPLHKPGFIALYFALCFITQTRLVGLGLSIHMLLDSIDCQVTSGVWITPSF
mgnify:CR=1 FL=1